MKLLQRLFGGNGSSNGNGNGNGHSCPSLAQTVHREPEVSPPSPRELSADELRTLLSSDQPPLLLDVREDQELRTHGWIRGAVHIPIGQIEDRRDELDPGKHCVVYCASGMRSYGVGAFLMTNGFENVSNLSGGIFSWNGEVERPQD